MPLAITGGRFKGARLRTPAGKNLTRPTSGKVRQALFNILRDAVGDTDFLDLYAGSGAVGLEALSRGCRKVTLVENHPMAFRALTENCKDLELRGVEAGFLERVKEDALKFCGFAIGKQRRFGIVFADPPFSLDFSGLWLKIQPLLDAEGVAAVQFPTRNPPNFTSNAARVYAYGESSLAVFGPAHF